MKEVKRKVDVIFLIIGILLMIYSILLNNQFIDVAAGYFIGFIVASIIIQNDLRIFNQGHNARISTRLVVKLLVYSISLAIAMKISDTSFLVAALVILTYRYATLFSFKKTL